MSSRARIAVTATAETALKRLKKNEIAVYDCKKSGADFIFCIKGKDAKKVFAIFAKPCYNVRVVNCGRRAGVLRWLLLRAGLVLGAAVFAAAAIISNAFCLKLEVVGSGAYLKGAVREILYDGGAGEGKPFSPLDNSLLSAKILALPNVEFCNISRHGCVLVVDVEVGESGQSLPKREALVADAGGKVTKIVAICGTAAVSAGDRVERGQSLILPFEPAGEETRPCLVVGFAEIECVKRLEYLATDAGEESIKRAYASALLEGDEIVSKSHAVKEREDGALIVMEITFLHKLSLNIN